MSTTSSPARRQLLETTEKLIYRSGILATGMDAIVKESGVSRKTIYSHFNSKEALVAQVLQDRDERWTAWFVTRSGQAETPAGRILATFDALHEWFHSEDFNGCAFINAAGEIGNPDDPIRAITKQHKLRLRDYLRQLAEEYAADDPHRMADELLILIDGAITVAKLLDRKEAAREAQQLAKKLLSL